VTEPVQPPRQLTNLVRDAAGSLHATAARVAAGGGATPVPGSVGWIAAPAGPPCLAVVISRHRVNRHDELVVVPLNDDLVAATPHDVLVDAASTGIGVPALAATDLVVHVLATQVMTVVGQVGVRDLARIAEVGRGRALGDGPPILDRFDGRLVLREALLDDAQRMAAPAIDGDLAEEDDVADEPNVPDDVPDTATSAITRLAPVIAFLAASGDLALAASERSPWGSTVTLQDPGGDSAGETQLVIQMVWTASGRVRVTVRLHQGPEIRWGDRPLTTDAPHTEEWESMPSSEDELRERVRQAISGS
jgi:hypothetical protein